MNKLGLHALVWEAGWSHDECARAIAKTAEVGYDFIEAPALDPSLIDPDFTRLKAEALFHPEKNSKPDTRNCISLRARHLM